MDINIDSQIVVQKSSNWAADNTVYSNKRILVTSDEYYGSTDQRKFKIADGTQTWSNLDYMPISQTLAQVLANGNSTNEIDIISNNGQSFIRVQDLQLYLERRTNNYLNQLTFATATVLAYENLLNGKYGSTYINDTFNRVQHSNLIQLDSPTINLAQGTVSKFLKTDASNNIEYVDSPVDVNTIGSAINGATSATPNDTDLVMSVDTSVAKKNTWTQIKTFLKTYFDTVYAATSSLANYVTLGTIQTITAQKTFETSNNTPTIVATHTSGSGEVLQINKSGNGEGIIINKLSGSGAAMSIYGASINLDSLTAGQILELNANKVVISVAKNSGYNLALGTTAGTVLEGNRITQTITNGVTDKAPSEDAVFDALALKANLTDSRFGSTFQCFAAVTSLSASTSYNFGCNPTLTASTGTTARVFSFMNAGTVTKVQLTISLTGTVGSSQACDVYLRNITTATDNLLGQITYDQGANTTTSFLWTPSITVANTTDFWTIKITTGAFTTNPTNVYHNARIFNQI
jgi:hypothetical protein